MRTPAINAETLIAADDNPSDDEPLVVRVARVLKPVTIQYFFFRPWCSCGTGLTALMQCCGLTTALRLTQVGSRSRPAAASNRGDGGCCHMQLALKCRQLKNAR